MSKVTVGIALSVLSGILAALSAPPFHAWPLIFVAFVPMIIAQHRILPSRWSWLAPGITLGLWFSSQILEGLVEAGVPFVFELLPLYAGLIVCALSWRTRRFHEESRYKWFLFATPAAWVALDFIRGTRMDVLASTWGNPAYALWAQFWLLQPVSVVGIYGLELLLLMLNWAISGLVIIWIDQRFLAAPSPFPRKYAIRSATGVAVVAILWTVCSFLMVAKKPPTLRVAAIQPGIGYHSDEKLSNAFEQTRGAAAAGARLIVWPEVGVPFDPRKERTIEFTTLAHDTQAYLVVGFSDTLPDRRKLNMAAVFSPDGSILGSYGKDHVVKFAGDSGDVRTGYPVWDTSIGRLAVIICADLDYTDTARHMAQGGAQIVAVPSNDPVPANAETHYTHLVFRAIENRVSLVKADSGRDAAAVDPWGRVIAKEIARNGRRSTLIADVPLGDHDSLLVRFGDWLCWLCLACTPLLFLTRIIRRLSSR